jgi:aspartyl-tRNA(Asn)/glutamyl-tRNA(Gln) amidotransferase subunit B
MIVDEVKASLSFAEVDDTAIENAVQLVLTTNESAVVSYKAGKTNVIGFLMGQVMKELKTKVDPKKVQEIMKKALE